MKKFELTSEFVTFLGKKLFRIKALISFGNVKEGELGGFVEKRKIWISPAMLGCTAMLRCSAMMTMRRCMDLAPNIVQLHFLGQKQEKSV